MKPRNFAICLLVSIVVFGTIYAVGQQILRQSANDPQIQLAEDIAHLLDGTAKPSDLASTSRIDMAASLAPFLVVTDSKGAVLETTGQLDGKDPAIPLGVFDSTKKMGQDRVTWQPRKGVRIALVVVPYKDGYVAVGRSLREVEKRENSVLQMAGGAWGALVILACIGYLGMARMRRVRAHSA